MLARVLSRDLRFPIAADGTHIGLLFQDGFWEGMKGMHLASLGIEPRSALRCKLRRDSPHHTH